MAIFLPNEIWGQIFSHLKVVLQDEYRDLEPLKTLTALSLVSRRFHNLAHTALYHTLLLWGLNDSYFDDRHDLHFLLAKTLANNPQLGLSTREISFAHGNLSIEHDVINLLGHKIGSLNMSSEFTNLLQRDIMFGQRGSGVASFLLALMPRVRLVELYFYKESSLALPYILGGRLSQDTIKPHTVANHLHHLQELRITSAQGQSCVNIDDFELILLHPTLRTLQLSGLDWTENKIMDMEWPDYPCNLRQLDLDECIVDASTMRDVLSRCTKLEISTISARSHGIAGQIPYRDWNMDLNEFGDVLRELGQNLVEFELDTWAYRRVRDARGKVGSLQSLKAVTHLSIARNDFVVAEDDPRAIPLVEALPTSIEIVDFKGDVIDSQMGHEEYRHEKMHDEMYRLAVGGQFHSLRAMTLFRPGIPRQHRFQRKVLGWDVEDTPSVVGSAFEALEYPYHVDMTLYMQRRDDGSEGVQES
ncbi:hypothetical protein NCS52_01363600 [Fusarium sp. LHS14.1]|nr:hypothetical protein NCS52_01363600 [Fusarium sp. LHS14.1]